MKAIIVGNRWINLDLVSDIWLHADGALVLSQGSGDSIVTLTLKKAEAAAVWQYLKDTAVNIPVQEAE